jgi:hypothetical protein
MGGTAAMEGCGNGAAGPGIDAGPEDGARFIAGAEGSGTDAGGTGGGWSLNIWAAAGEMIAQISPPASANAAGKHRRRPNRSMPFPPRVMSMLFTENAANSSLRVCSLLARNLQQGRCVDYIAAIQSQCPPSPALSTA